jgi:hypothetical protein
MRLALAALLSLVLAIPACDSDDAPQEPASSANYIEQIRGALRSDPRKALDRESATCPEIVEAMRDHAGVWLDIEAPEVMAASHTGVGESLIVAADRFEEAGSDCKGDPAGLSAAEDYRLNRKAWCVMLMDEYRVDIPTCE